MTLEKTGDIASLDADDALNALHHVQVSSSRIVARIAVDLGIAAPDLRALYFLSMSDSVTPKALGAHLGLTTGSVTSLVDRLVDRGYVERVPHPSDRRSVTLALTDSGRTVVASVSDRYRQALASTVGDDGIPAIVRSLRALGGALEHLAREH